MSYHSNRQFTTKDLDHDGSGDNCAVQYHGAWWYNQCYFANLNGKYRNVGPGDNTGLEWWHWIRDHGYSLKHVSMKIRPHT